MNSSTLPARGDATREALILAAMTVFSRDGFDAVTTRQIATKAGVNQALIGYHFGGKEALYLAVFEHIALQVQQRMGPAAQQIQALLRQPPTRQGAAARRKAWLPPILQIVDQMLSMMLSPETTQWAQLMLREQARPTAAFDLVYGGFMGRMLNLLVELAVRLRGDQDKVHARLLVIGILGQVVVWRAARESASRLLEWREFGPQEMDRIREAVRRNVTAQLLA